MKLKGLSWYSPKQAPECGQSILMVCSFKTSDDYEIRYMCSGIYISRYCENVRLADLPYSYHNGDYGGVVELDYRDYDDEYYIPCGFYETVESTINVTPKLILIEDNIVAWTPITMEDLKNVEVNK